MTVDSVDVTTFSVKGEKRGRADVVIRDDLGGPVANATVYGEFSGDITTESLSGMTNPSGLATIDSSVAYLGKGKPSLTFCVTSVTHDTLANLQLGGPGVCQSN